MSPENIRAMAQEALKSTLPKAVHDATAELVGVIVKDIARAELMKAMQPMMSRLQQPAQGGTGLSAFDEDTVASFMGLEKGAKDSRDSQIIGKKTDGSPILKGRVDQRVDDPRALYYDPFTALDQMGFRERPSSITYRTLGEMARRVPPYAAILQTRINQMASFAEPQADEHSVGFKVVLRDKNIEMTDELTARAAELTRWVLRCGNPDLRKKRQSFEQYLRMSTWDSLVYDQMTSEVLPDRRGTPAYWRVVDAATIRISDDLDAIDEDDDSIRYVQIQDDTIVAEFEEHRLLYGIRNPRSDIRYAGYGQSELELLVVIVTAILWGIDYNAKFFRQGTVAKGILNFKGAIPDKELIAFRRQWYAMISGVENAWRTPVVNADELQWVDMHTNNRDMEFSNWLDWLLKITCAVTQIAPEEIGFQFGNTGQSSSMSEGNQEWKLKFSKDKGLVPLAKFHAAQLNKIIERIDPRFQIQFAGINARTAEELIDLQTKEVATVKTVDEARKERGKPPMPNGLGDVILNPTWVQWATAKMQGGGGAGQPGVPEGASFDTDGLDGDDQGQQGPKPGAQGTQDQDPRAAGRTNPQAMGLNSPGDVEKSIKSLAQRARADLRKARGSRILDLEIDL